MLPFHLTTLEGLPGDNIWWKAEDEGANEDADLFSGALLSLFPLR